MSMTNSVIKRFLKGFVGSGIASMVLVVQSGYVIHSIEDLKKLGGVLAIAFITGGLLAIEKAINWSTEPSIQ